MDEAMSAIPILSTPDTHLLDATVPLAYKDPVVLDEELMVIYDIERTLAEIRQGRWKRIALQFPDEMLPDAPRVFQLLSRGLQQAGPPLNPDCGVQKESKGSLSDIGSRLDLIDNDPPKLYILADTSYGSCCVDEVAAEHINADVIVHYGRTCLSPTARLPVVYVFTSRPLALGPLVAAFKETYPNHLTKIIITADVNYSDHISAVYQRLLLEGYSNLFAASLIHNPSSAIPNRTVPDSIKHDLESLKTWQLFHISDPPTALLLTLSSRVSDIHIFPTREPGPNEKVKPLPVSTAAALRRRYGILTSLSTAPIFGILINTLSVKNYLHIANHVKSRIAAAGKKSYMFVVGKLNAAKVANFSEIEGWVVIGCWESSLIDSKDFWKPVITPFELELVLSGDMSQIWTGSWSSDYQTVLDAVPTESHAPRHQPVIKIEVDGAVPAGMTEADDSEPESTPPEFDLRTGRYVSNTRPMRDVGATGFQSISSAERPTVANALAKRMKGDVATIGGTISPGAEFLRSRRTWRGLGSDFELRSEEDGDVDNTVVDNTVVEGRRGIARGYTVGDSVEKH